MFRFRSQAIRIIAATGLFLSLLVVRVKVPAAAAPTDRMQTGIDVYESMNSKPYAGKRVAIVTNQTGVDSPGLRTIDALAGTGATLVAIFSPEHGISGNRDADIPDSRDLRTGAPIYSLYGATRRPSDEMLRGVDVLFFDIQDAGARFYTYVTTMAYCMEAAAKHHIEFVVFDRPDPLGGDLIEGPMLDPGRTSFTGYFPMPVRYGMTMGELAKMFNAENRIGANLHVFEMRGWHREEPYDQTGLKWIPPSPNLRSVNEAFLYPGIEILQAGGVSVGRGTDTPFETLGAPWIDAEALARELTQRVIPGVTFAATSFTPNDSPFAGELCNGVRMTIAGRRAFRTMRLGLEIADALHKMYPARFQLEKTIALLGSQSTIDRLKAGDAPASIVAGWSPDLDRFRKTREKYLLYH